MPNEGPINPVDVSPARANTRDSPGVGDPVVVDVIITSSYGNSALTTSDRFTYTN